MGFLAKVALEVNKPFSNFVVNMVNQIGVKRCGFDYKEQNVINPGIMIFYNLSWN